MKDRTYEDVVEQIKKKLNLNLTEKQECDLNKILRDYHWLPNEHNHVRVFKVYQEMKLATETELSMLVAKANTIVSSDPSVSDLADELRLRIALLRTFNDKLDTIVTSYSTTFASIMKTYSMQEAMIFKYIYFDGKTSKEVAQLTNYSLTKIYNLKTKFEKALNNTEKVLV